MHTTNSYLYTLCERIRAYLDDPDVDAKYTNDYLVRHIISPSQADVLSRLNNTIGSPIILKFELTYDEDETHYTLPPCIQEVLRLVVVDEEGGILLDIVPRDRMNMRGEQWALEGAPGCFELRLNVAYPITSTIEVWYVSNGDVHPHYGTGGTLANQSGTDRFTLDLTPTLGSVDRRPNAYAGQILRLLPDSPAAIEERVITTSYVTSSVWYVEVRKPFTHTADAGSLTYEIAPAGSQMLYEAIAVWGAMKMGTGRKISQAHQSSLRTQYLQALKTIGDNLTNIQTRVGHHFVRDTIDNPNSRVWGWSHPVR